MKVTIRNEFHNTEATVIPQAITEGRFKGYYRITRKTALRLKSKLCGANGCTCGDDFGARMSGSPLRIVNEDSDRSYIVDVLNYDE